MRSLIFKYFLLSGFFVFSHDSEFVFGVKTFTDYHEGLSFAKKNSKRILLYFNSESSASCRKLEKNVFSNEIVKLEIRKKYIIINLLVDSKSLPKKKLVLKNGELATSVGEYNLDLETQFKKDYQPYLITMDEKLNFIEGIDYTNDTKKFVKFLTR